MDNLKSLELEVFVAKILEEKGTAKLGPDIVAQMKADLYERLENIVNATIIRYMPENKLGDFEGLLDSEASGEEIRAFILKYIPNIDEFIAQAMINFRNKYLNIKQ